MFNDSKEKDVKSQIEKDEADLLVPDDELDALLDDALKDFDKKPEKVEATKKDVENTCPDDKEKDCKPQPDDHLFDLTNNLTDVLEKMVMNEPSLKAQFNSFQQQMDSSSNAFADGGPDLFDVDGDMAKQLEELTKNLGEDGGELENMFKQMQGELDGGDGDFGGEGDGFMSMMKGMMQNLLSKDLLYPSLKDIQSKYPVWLEENKSKISSEEYEKYSKQQTIVCQICELFDEEKENDNETVKSERMSKIVSLMEQMQEYGHPPSDMMENVVCGNNIGGSAPPECNLM